MCFCIRVEGGGELGGGEWVGGNIRLLNVDGKVVVTFFYLIESPFYLHEKHVWLCDSDFINNILWNQVPLWIMKWLTVESLWLSGKASEHGIHSLMLDSSNVRGMTSKYTRRYVLQD